MKHAYGISDAPYHCPQCSAKEFRRVMAKKFLCEHCGFELFMNASTGVCALITDCRNRLLVTMRARQPAQSQLDLPGGFVDPGETAEHAIRREVKEELGLEVETLSYFCSEANTSYIYGGVNYQSLDLAFICQVRSPSLARADDDVQSVHFVSLEEVNPQAFGFISIRKIVRRFCDDRQALQNR